MTVLNKMGFHERAAFRLYPVEQLLFLYGCAGKGVDVMIGIMKSCSFVYWWKVALCSDPPTYLIFPDSANTCLTEIIQLAS